MTASAGAKKRRFIAGAVCQKCRELDRLVLEVDANNEQQQRRCVACGFSETMQGESTQSNGIPRARFERSQAKAVESQPVRILDPGLIQSTPSKNS